MDEFGAYFAKVALFRLHLDVNENVELDVCVKVKNIDFSILSFKSNAFWACHNSVKKLFERKN